jgi:hypothetical protein
LRSGHGANAVASAHGPKELGNVYAVGDIESSLFDKAEIFLKADSCPFGELRVGNVE